MGAGGLPRGEDGTSYLERMNRAMGAMPLTDEIDLIDPTLSQRRQWICLQLAKALPNNVIRLASNDKKTSVFFEDWTGQSQSNLETAWDREGFKRATTREEKEKGVWVRNGGGPVTTSCEGLITSVISKLTAAEFGKPIRGKMSSFNLPGCNNGKEPAQATVGWHWWRDRTPSLHPQPGDFFQIGSPIKAGLWSFAHVGIITGWADERNPVWTTVEAGQAGPSSGFDFVKRKGPRQLDPINSRHPKKQLMGWLDLDEFFCVRTAKAPRPPKGGSAPTRRARCGQEGHGPQAAHPVDTLGLANVVTSGRCAVAMGAAVLDRRTRRLPHRALPPMPAPGTDAGRSCRHNRHLGPGDRQA